MIDKINIKSEIMQCCADCGFKDNINNMFLIEGDEGERLWICFKCSQKYGLNCTQKDNELKIKV